MKKCLLFALALAILLSCFSAGHAEGFGTEELSVMSGGSEIRYVLRTDYDTMEQYAVITSVGPARDLVIPGEVNGIPVRMVGQEEPGGMEGIISNEKRRSVVRTLTIGEGIRGISSNAFSYLPKLEKVTLPDTLEWIGLCAFSECCSLSEIRMPEQFDFSGLEVGAFASTGLEDIVLADGTSLTQYTWDQGREGQDLYLSTYADGWDYVKLRDGTGCITGWHGYPDLEEGAPVIVPGQLGNVRITRISRIMYGEISDIPKVVLPEGLKEIGEEAFLRWASLEEINLPESLEKIGFAALAGVGAEGLRLPENAKEKSDPLWYCTDFRTDTSGEYEYCVLPDGTAAITAIRTGEKKEITIPAELDGIAVKMICRVSPSILQMSGTDNADLKKVTVSEGIEIIGTNAFREFVKLESVELPKSLKVIGETAFCQCQALKSIKLPEGLEEIGDKAFVNSGLKSVEIPESVARTGTAPFGGWNLTKATLPKAWTAVPDSLFENARGLKSINLPKGITRIGNNAFMNCLSLTGITMPEGLISIGENAFSQNVGSNGEKPSMALKSVKFPASLQTVGKKAFAGSDALTKITFEKNAQLQEIGQQAFAMCARLKEISLPDTLEKLGEGAFADCAALKKVNLGKGITAAGAEAFLHDGEMTGLTVPDTLTEIGDNLIGGHHEKLKVTCGQGSAMEKWLQASFPEVVIVYPKK